MKMQGWGSGARFFFIVRRIGLAIMSGWQCHLGTSDSILFIGQEGYRAMISLQDIVIYILQATGDCDASQTHETFMKTHGVLEAMEHLLRSFNWTLAPDMQGAVQGWKYAVQYLVHANPWTIGSIRDVIVDNTITRTLVLKSSPAELLAKWSQLK
jgi:hypothetical protein